MSDRFDEEGARFEERAGLPDDAAREIASAIEELAGRPQGRVLLDIGAGSGSPGRALAEAGWRYVGLDRSAQLLEAFAGASPRVRLVRCDAAQPWPVREGAAQIVFLSRAAHLLDEHHLAREAWRALAPGGLLLIGRVERDRDGLQASLRRHLQDLLRARGHEPRRGGQADAARLERFVQLGAEPIPARPAAEVRREESLAGALASWRSKPGLAGVDLATDEKAGVLAALETWAHETLADRGAARPVRDRYMLSGARRPD